MTATRHKSTQLRWLVFADDEVLVAADQVALVRALDVGDIDPQTQALVRSIPDGKVTRIETKGNGYVWVSTPFQEVVESLSRINERSDADAE